MPMRLALGVRGTVAEHKHNALKGGGRHPQCVHAPPPPAFVRHCRCGGVATRLYTGARIPVDMAPTPTKMAPGSKDMDLCWRDREMSRPSVSHNHEHSRCGGGRDPPFGWVDAISHGVPLCWVDPPRKTCRLAPQKQAGVGPTVWGRAGWAFKYHTACVGVGPSRGAWVVAGGGGAQEPPRREGGKRRQKESENATSTGRPICHRFEGGVGMAQWHRAAADG